MKKTKLAMALFAVVFSFQISTAVKAGDANLETGDLKVDPKQDYNPNLLIFTGEVRNFMELAQVAKAGNLDPAKEKAIIEEMGQTGTRVARVYFQEMTEVNRAELNQFLTTQLQENSDQNQYFVLLGNAFAIQADKLIQQNANYRKGIRIWTTVGGVVLGVALGGGYLYFQSTKAALQTKDYMIAAGALLVGAGVGYGGGLVYTHSLPIDRSVTNATDFIARYPHGEDFIKDLNPTNLDLALALDDLEVTE